MKTETLTTFRHPVRHAARISFALLALLGLLMSTGCELDSQELRNELDARLTPTPEPPAPPAADNPSPAPAPDNGGLPAGSSNTFLWKPVSESNGNLVILLPAIYRGRVQSTTISGSFGSETGRFHTDTHNGFRPHFRFSRPGAAYGSNITVQALYDGNKIESWVVPNGASRYEENR